MKKEYVVIVALIVLIGIGLDYISYQRKQIQGFKEILQDLSGQVEKLTAEKKNNADMAGELANKLEVLDSGINQYLAAENRKCEKDTVDCLDELIGKLEPSQIKCEPISDGICPKFCGLSLDYDCCIEKGYKWIAGQGCYS